MADDQKTIQSHYTAHEYELCLDLASKILHTNPDDFDALCYKGASLGKLGRHEEAVKEFTRCILLRDDAFHSYVFRGDSYYEMGKYHEAADDYRKSLELEANGAVMDKCARALFRIGDYTDALGWIKKVVDIGESPEPVIVMVTMLDRLGLTGEAHKVGSIGAATYPEDNRFSGYRN